MKTFDLILFDLDGTLLDTMKLITTSYQITIRHFTGKTVEAAHISKLVGTSIHNILSHFAVEPTAETIGFYKKTSAAMHDDMVLIYPGVSETLQLLKEKQVSIGLVTSKIKDLAAMGLALFSLEPFFDVLVCMEDTTKHKPDPEPVLEACRRLAVRDLSRVLMVGDSPFDIRCAKRAGVKTAVVTWSDFSPEELAAEEPDYTIASMQQLIDLLATGAD
ncbi:HAD-IA family hydrolase [Propionispora vibrioides]|uniref:Pyrophosphatase PpaX n=1 Tax=Propionispora vibrioides TaxID=112903 RepID=A0A1H8QXD5_9FIRM|nr:HAD-IA family hydrolase [Propionispora vibrioides]SEO58835.1 pyrophosphatase PpaX [Propionispora vibrioides]